MFLKTALAFLLACTCMASGAQVYRCTDPATKRTTYSDAPCADGTQIVRQRSSEELQLDEDRAAASRKRFYDDQATERSASLNDGQELQAGPSLSKADSHECKRAKHELSIASNIRTLSDRDKTTRVNAAIAAVNASCGTNTELMQKSKRGARVSPLHDAPKPTVITNCTDGFCYDNTGGVYHRSGSDFMTGPNGRTCHRAGSIWNCN